MKTPPIKLFGDRVLLQEVEEEITGSLILPQSAQRAYRIGAVTILGNGKIKRSKGTVETVEMLVKPGEYVWFQYNPYMAQNNSFQYKGKTYMHCMQHDMLAKLTAPHVVIDNFEILGVWALLKPFEDHAEDSLIVLPDKTDSPSSRALRYKVHQAGSHVDNVKVGDEVVIERQKAHSISIGRTNLATGTLENDVYFYLDSSYICGVVN